MIYQKDWLMRQIESMIAAIIHFLTQTTKPEDEVLILQSLNEESDRFLEQGDMAQYRICIP